jgi:hypothetical protein
VNKRNLAWTAVVDDLLRGRIKHKKLLAQDSIDDALKVSLGLQSADKHPPRAVKPEYPARLIWETPLQSLILSCRGCGSCEIELTDKQTALVRSEYFTITERQFFLVLCNAIEQCVGR